MLVAIITVVIITVYSLCAALIELYRPTVTEISKGNIFCCKVGCRNFCHLS